MSHIPPSRRGGEPAESAPPPAPSPEAKARGAYLTPLAILATVVTLAALHLAAGVVVPLVLSLLAAFALNPVVSFFERLWLPRWLAAGVTMLSLVGALAGGAWLLRDDAMAAAQRLPEATERIRRELIQLRGGAPGPTLDALEKAADDIEAGVTEATGASRTRSENGGINIGLRDWVLVGSITAIGFSGQLVLLGFLLYFLLASGDLFRRKLVKLAGPALSRRRITVEVLDSIRQAIERFFVVMLSGNVLVAVLSFLAFWGFGLANAGLWAIFGGTLNTVPYVGSAVATAALFVVSLLQFEEMTMALLVAGTFLAITSVEGLAFKPWFMSRAARLNNVATLTGLLFWGWLWGVWGMLLAYPIMMVTKTIADRVESFKPFGELLGE